MPPINNSKSVTFANECEVFEITHIDEIPDEDIAAIWYDGEEYSEIKKSYQLTIYMMESGEPITGDEHTTRGLEYRTQEGAWARYENKRDAYNAVLDEQDRQWKEDHDDCYKISEIYLEHSTKCRNAAILRGMQDEEDIREYLRAPPDKVKKKKKKRPDGERSKRSHRTTGTDNAQKVLKERSSSKRDEEKSRRKKALAT